METSTDLGRAYRRAVEQASTVVAGITQDQLGAQTPCSEWNTRELLNHFVGSCRMMAAAGAGRELPSSSSGTDAVASMGDLLGDRPAAAYEEASAAAREAFEAPGALERTWTLPFGEVPGEVARNIHLMETIAHTWDLAKCTGQLAKLDPELAEIGHSTAKGIVQPQFRNEKGDPFAAEVTVPASAGAYEHFAGFLGRQP